MEPYIPLTEGRPLAPKDRWPSSPTLVSITQLTPAKAISPSMPKSTRVEAISAGPVARVLV